MLGYYPPVMQNRIENNIEHATETGIMYLIIGVIV